MTRRTRCAKAKRQKLVSIHVVWSAADGWHITENGKVTFEEISSVHEAVRWAYEQMRNYLEGGASGVSIRLHRKDGKMRKDGERTYPRSADPRRSHG